MKIDGSKSIEGNLRKGFTLFLVRAKIFQDRMTNIVYDLNKVFKHEIFKTEYFNWYKNEKDFVDKNFQRI